MTTSKDWLTAYLGELETAANKALGGQLYEDANGRPSSVAGLGSLGLAAITLATEIAAKSDDPDELMAVVYRHKAHVEHTLGPDAWADVLYGVVLQLAVLYLEPAYKVTDTSGIDVRSATRQWWEAISTPVEPTA